MHAHLSKSINVKLMIMVIILGGGLVVVRVWARIPSQSSQIDNHCPFLMLTLPAYLHGTLSLSFFFFF